MHSQSSLIDPTTRIKTLERYPPEGGYPLGGYPLEGYPLGGYLLEEGKQDMFRFKAVVRGTVFAKRSWRALSGWSEMFLCILCDPGCPR